MMINLIKEGLLEQADEMLSSMENSGCDPDSRMLNLVVRALLEKHEVVRAGIYLSKIDEMNFLLEASTTKLLMNLFASKGTCQEHLRFLPEKYHFIAGAGSC
jgi:pentatricopeptide repeat protein